MAAEVHMGGGLNGRVGWAWSGSAVLTKIGLVMQPSRLDQNTWLPRSMRSGVGRGLGWLGWIGAARAMALLDEGSSVARMAWLLG